MGHSTKSPDQTNGLARRSVQMSTSKPDGILVTLPRPQRSLSSGTVADIGVEATQGVSRMSQPGSSGEPDVRPSSISSTSSRPK